ncbi:MAG TPA: O-antigen ligase family protein [Candidatus Limnocylindrales bacterium]
MSFWDGERWVREGPSADSAPNRRAFAGGAFIREEVRLPPGPALVAAVAAIIGFAVGTGYAVQAAGLVAGIAALWVSFRWPLLPLFAYAALIPIEEILVLGDLGTLSRLASILFILAYGLPRIRHLRIEAMPIAAWGYVGWSVLSVGWAINRGETLTQIPILLSLFITSVLIAVVVADRPWIVRPLLWAYSLSAGVTALLGIAKYLSSSAPIGTNDRVAAIAGQSVAYYAAYLLPALIFCMFELIQYRRVIISGAIALASTAGILVSGTRSAWVAAGLVIVGFVLPQLRPGRRIAAVGLVLGMAFLALQIPGISAVVIQRAEIALSSGGAGRTDIWTVGVAIYEGAPLTGVGLANFPVAYTPELVRQSNVGVYSAVNPANRAPHNIVIGTLGELGPIGFFLLLLFVLPLIFRRGWGPDAAVVQAGVASLMITAIFLDLLNRKQLWLFFGLACGLAYIRNRRLEGRLALAAIPPTAPVAPGPPVTSALGPDGKVKFSGIVAGDEPPVSR